MAAMTPRRSTRPTHNHTPRMSERKKGLFLTATEPSRESLTKHRRLPVVDSESDSEECDLGIISTLDSSSGEDNDHSTPKTPERKPWRETRSHTRKLIENQDLKSFMKSPFTLKKYQTRYSCPETRCGSSSTPATPHLQYHPGTPSSSHSCASAHTTSSTSSRARKSLASLIADTESCSSSLKDLTFDTDSGTDSKENTPTKSVRRSGRKQKMTPKLSSFKGILVEQKKQNSPLKSGINHSPMKTAVVCLTKMDMSAIVSPSQVKTPQTSQISESIDSPPKIGHSRRPALEIGESPESVSDNEKSLKRFRNNSLTDHGPSSKYPRLDIPKARLSLFNSDRLKEMLSTKSFYGKSNPELNTSLTAKISNAIEVSTVQNRKSFGHSYSHKRRRQPGQINMGVKHKIRKPKHQKNKAIVKKYSANSTANSSLLNNSTLNSTQTNGSANDASMISQNSTHDLAADKLDFFDKENQTIEALLSQWEEDDVPESELPTNQELPCFNSTIIEETSAIFQPVTAVPVTEIDIHTDSQAVIVELGAKNVTIPPQNTQTTVSETVMTTLSQNLATVSQNVATVSQNLATVSQTLASVSQNMATVSQNISSVPENVVQNQDVVMAEPERHASIHGVAKSSHLLPVEGGYVLVEEDNAPAQQEDLPDLDEIERELRMLDEQILQMAHSNNINAAAVLACTETGLSGTEAASPSPVEAPKSDKPAKLFPIFSNPNPGTATPSSKADKPSKKSLLKNCSDQYVIDAGQNKFGATQCAECGVIYQIGDPQDEHDHLVHHNATDVLKYNGWKDAHTIESVSTSSIIRVRHGDASWRRVETLLHRVIHPQLGYEGPINASNAHSLTAYLYIEKKQIVGCLIAETKTKAYKLIPGDPDCCSVEDYPVKCGISRVWTHINYRRRGIARRLVDCARASMFYGLALPVSDVAFSAPTAAGKEFATKYCGTENFYVYLD